MTGAGGASAAGLLAGRRPRRLYALAGGPPAAESRDGPIDPGCAVLLCTGWDRFCEDPARYLCGNDSAAPPIAVVQRRRRQGAPAREETLAAGRTGP